MSMGFLSRKEISYKSLSYAILCLWLCGSNGFEIYRSKRDIFTNLADYDRSGPDQCSRYGAECFTENCTYCRCSEGTTTFMISDYNMDDEIVGECKRDEDIVPESVPQETFWLKNNQFRKCLKLQNTPSNYIIGAPCGTRPTHDMLWLWTATENKQLINIKTLKCMSRQGNGKQVIMKQCDSKSPEQKIKCNNYQLKSVGVKIGWKVGRRQQWTLVLRRLPHDGLTYAISSKDKQMLWSTYENYCVTNQAYKGCYRFSDGSFMKYLNYSEKNPKLRISAPIFKENNGNCNAKTTFQYLGLHDQEWKDRAGELFSINKDTKEIEFTTMELFKAWNGSLLKLFVVCGSEEHCVLLKVASLPTYSDESLSEEASESGGTNSAAIAVTVSLLLVALALGLGFLVYYRRRRRAQVSQNSINDTGVVNYSKEIYEDPDRIYEKLKENENTVSCSQPGPSSDTYSYPDGNIIANPPSIEQEYTYAKETDFPRSSTGTKPEAKGQINNGVEQPGVPSDDGFYNYPENTNIAKPPASELEYTYAKDTDIPRVTTDKTAVPEEPASNAVYHTLEQEQAPTTDVYKHPGANIPTELEYTYAKDTEIPRITIDTKSEAKGDGVPATSTSDALYHTLEQEEPAAPDQQEYSYAKNIDTTSIPLGTQQNNGHSSPPDSSGLYHTLEEPKLLHPPVCSTLNESADDANTQK